MDKLFIITMVVALSSNFAFAQQEEILPLELEKIVVTATRTEGLRGQIGTSVSVITKEEIENRGAKLIVDALRDVPGIDVVQTGGLGGITSIFLRGANSEHTLVMIDGVEVNDPMSAARSFDFAHLTTDNIERIEVIRGPQSTLYGSDAIAGVINIITRKGKGKPKLYILTEAGRYDTAHEAIGLSGSSEKINYSLQASRLDSDGISKASGGVEEDSYSNTTLSANLGIGVFNDSELSFIMRYIDAKADIDDGAYDDDPNYTTQNNTFLFKTQFKNPLSEWWQQKITLSLLDVERKYRDEPDVLDSGSYYDQFDGENRKLDWQHNFFIGKNIITSGFEYEEEQGSSETFDKKTVENKAFYLQNQFKFGRWLFVTAGVRVDDHEKFGSDTNYKLSGAYIIKPAGTKLKANWGTGFKAPSLFQLYSGYGDENLAPEENESYDLGFEQSLLEGKLFLDCIYFHNNFDQMIEYNFNTSKYQNIGRAKTEGTEIGLFFKPLNNLKIGANYTRTDTQNKSTGKKLIRRPKNKYNLNLKLQPTEKISASLILNYFGSRWNNTSNTEKMKGYTRVDIASSYQLNKDIQIFGRVENLFDRTYQEVLGYATPGISFYAGTKISF